MAAPVKVPFILSAEGQDQVAGALNKVNHDLGKVSKSAGRLNGAFRGMRGGTAQLGYQIQDVAVQLQAGQNALLVFGQQGSQIASLMGPGGALIGAVIAVGAAVGTALVPELFKGEESLEDFAEKAKEAAEELDGLTGAMREAAAAEVERNFNSLLKTNLDLNDQLKLAEAAAKSAGNGFKIGGKTAKEWQQTIVLINAAIQENEGLLQLLSNRLSGSSSATEDLIEKLEEEAATLGATDRAVALHTAYLAGATQADYDKINSLYDRIEAHEAEQEALKASEKLLKNAAKQDPSAAEFDRAAKIFDDLEALESALMTETEVILQSEIDRNNIVKKALDERIINEEYAAELIKKIHQDTNMAVQENTRQAYQNAVSTIGQQTTSIMGMLDKQSGAYKALFVVQQATQIASAIMNAHAAQNLANATIPPPAGPILGGVMLALGYANAAAIAGQTIAGFEGGGITFNGVRSGGLDGKGGRMAVVHPNEKITDLEKGGGGAQAVNISFNIQANDAAGFDELLVRRRALIVNMVNKAVNNSGRRSLT